MAQPPYRLVHHTADMAVEFYGADLRELFEHAGMALMACLIDPATVRSAEYRVLAAEGADPEELLVDFLRELLYLANGRRFLTKDLYIDDLDTTQCSVRVAGEVFDASRHIMEGEIKAVTYHGIRIEKVGDGLKGRVIFDV